MYLILDVQTSLGTIQWAQQGRYDPNRQEYIYSPDEPTRNATYEIAIDEIGQTISVPQWYVDQSIGLPTGTSSTDYWTFIAFGVTNMTGPEYYSVPGGQTYLNSDSSFTYYYLEPTITYHFSNTAPEYVDAPLVDYTVGIFSTEITQTINYFGSITHTSNQYVFQYLSSYSLAYEIATIATLSISDALPIVEGEGAEALFTISLSQALPYAVTVDYATQDGSALAGEDYDARSGILTFEPGETTKTIAVPTIDDSLAEPDESFFVVLSGTAADGGPLPDIMKPVGVSTITDDDTPTFYFAPAITYEGDRNSSVLITLVASKPASEPYSVTVTIAGGDADFEQTSVTVSIPAFAITADIEFRLTGDTFAEPDEIYNVQASTTAWGGIQTSAGEIRVINLSRDFEIVDDYLRSHPTAEIPKNPRMTGTTEAVRQALDAAFQNTDTLTDTIRDVFADAEQIMRDDMLTYDWKDICYLTGMTTGFEGDSLGKLLLQVKAEFFDLFGAGYWGADAVRAGYAAGQSLIRDWEHLDFEASPPAGATDLFTL